MLFKGNIVIYLLLNWVQTKQIETESRRKSIKNVAYRQLKDIFDLFHSVKGAVCKIVHLL